MLQLLISILFIVNTQALNAALLVPAGKEIKKTNRSVISEAKARMRMSHTPIKQTGIMKKTAFVDEKTTTKAGFEILFVTTGTNKMCADSERVFPANGWNNYGVKNGEADCFDSCQADQACNVAVWRPANKYCTGFKSCNTQDRVWSWAGDVVMTEKPYDYGPGQCCKGSNHQYFITDEHTSVSEAFCKQKCAENANCKYYEHQSYGNNCRLCSGCSEDPNSQYWEWNEFDDPCASVTCVPLSACHQVGTCSRLNGICSNPVGWNGRHCNVEWNYGTCMNGVCKHGMRHNEVGSHG